LLARIPAEYQRDWVMGHFQRVLPKGYEKTVRTGQNVIEDPVAHAYYDGLRRVIRGGLWSKARWHFILHDNLGQIAHPKGSYYRCEPAEFRAGVAVYDLASMRESTEDGSNWNSPGNVQMGGPIIVRFGERTIKRVSIGADRADIYRIEAKRAKGWREIAITTKSDGTGMKNYSFDLAETVTTSEIKITPIDGDGLYSIGRVSLE
jgi:hypothetical protein